MIVSTISEKLDIDRFEEVLILEMLRIYQSDNPSKPISGLLSNIKDDEFRVKVNKVIQLNRENKLNQIIK
jgi:hypothetical protein